MPNTLIVKLATDHLVSCYRVNQDYSDPWLSDKVTYFQDEFNGGSPAVGYALVHTDGMAAAQDSGKEYIPGPGETTCDFDVIQKSAITTETAILPEGLTLDDINDSDYVVVYS